MLLSFFRCFALGLLLLTSVSMAGAQSASQGPTPESMRSPVNQVFQFMQSGEYTWPSGWKVKATAYLWIPEQCHHLRGLLIMGINVPEQMLAGNPKIRDICVKHDLGIVYASPSFLNPRKEDRADLNRCGDFLQQLLAGLAQTSGYPEVATVPWVPMGESGHLLMVDALVEGHPDRCIAGIWLKNNHLPPKNRTVPALVIFGSAQEWGQDQGDISNHWNNVQAAYESVLSQCKASPNWPLTYAIDGWSGHFDCSERLVSYIAQYLDDVCTARLPDQPDQQLKPLDLSQGFLADLPVPGHENKPVVPVAKADPGDRGYPWFFSEAAAKEAQSIAHINWSAKSQLVAFANVQGQVFPFIMNGISWMDLNQKPSIPTKQALPDMPPQPIIVSEDDGITFSLRGVLLDKVPFPFKIEAPLVKTSGDPTLEWLCGDAEPLGNNRFRLAIDRNWPSPIYLAVRQPGTAEVRGVIQPGQIDRGMNCEGAPSKITFPAVPNVQQGTASVDLHATADSGLPVRYFVVAGPATIQGSKVVFSAIPPNSKFPITVTVGAWQWGRYTEPKIHRADIVRTTFQITK